MKATPRTACDIGKAITDYKLKPFVFPPDFGICIDTREQDSIFGARLPKGLTVCSKTLKNGDYSIFGMEDYFAVEKKQISDLLSYMTTERELTKQKMERFKKMKWVGLMVVVNKESELYRPYIYSSISPEVTRQSLASFEVKYNIHLYVGNKENCCRWFVDRAIKFYRMMKEL